VHAQTERDVTGTAEDAAAGMSALQVGADVAQRVQGDYRRAAHHQHMRERTRAAIASIGCLKNFHTVDFACAPPWRRCFGDGHKRGYTREESLLSSISNSFATLVGLPAPILVCRPVQANDDLLRAGNEAFLGTALHRSADRDHGLALVICWPRSDVGDLAGESRKVSTDLRERQVKHACNVVQAYQPEFL
jgi:hypothetical protein